VRSDVIVIGDVLAECSLQGIDRERNDPSSDLEPGSADEPFGEDVAVWTSRWRSPDLASDRPETLDSKASLLGIGGSGWLANDPLEDSDLLVLELDESVEVLMDGRGAGDDVG
jgi:hypothetical protein